jgi:hypothetical protein
MQSLIRDACIVMRETGRRHVRAFIFARGIGAV